MPKHPAKYTDAFLPLFRELLLGYDRVLDPFGGTGKLKQVRPDAVCMDIEPEWGAECGLTADALKLPFGSGSFDAICTSPTYGNRMADKTPGRVSYAAYLGRLLSDNNSGAMQWGSKYREFHRSAWREARRVIRDDGRFVLNIKDHIRAKKRVFVTDWHIDTLSECGFRYVNRDDIDAPGSATHLTNGDARVPFESIVWFEAI